MIADVARRLRENIQNPSRLTEANYDWMSDGLLYQHMGQSWLSNHEFIVDNDPEYVIETFRKRHHYH